MRLEIIDKRRAGKEGCLWCYSHLAKFVGRAKECSDSRSRFREVSASPWARNAHAALMERISTQLEVHAFLGRGASDGIVPERGRLRGHEPRQRVTKVLGPGNPEDAPAISHTRLADLELSKTPLALPQGEASIGSVWWSRHQPVHFQSLRGPLAHRSCPIRARSMLAQRQNGCIRTSELCKKRIARCVGGVVLVAT